MERALDGHPDILLSLGSKAVASSLLLSSLLLRAHRQISISSTTVLSALSPLLYDSLKKKKLFINYFY